MKTGRSIRSGFLVPFVDLVGAVDFSSHDGPLFFSGCVAASISRPLSPDDGLLHTAVFILYIPPSANSAFFYHNFQALGMNL